MPPDPSRSSTRYLPARTVGVVPTSILEPVPASQAGKPVGVAYILRMRIEPSTMRPIRSRNMRISTAPRRGQPRPTGALWRRRYAASAAMAFRRNTNAVMAGGAALVFVALEVAIAWQFPIFFDEALFAGESQLFVDHPTVQNAFLGVGDNHGVLQRWLGSLQVAVGMPSVTALRIVSVLAGLVTI